MTLHINPMHMRFAAGSSKIDKLLARENAAKKSLIALAEDLVLAKPQDRIELSNILASKLTDRDDLSRKQVKDAYQIIANSNYILENDKLLENAFYKALTGHCPGQQYDDRTGTWVTPADPYDR